MDPEISTNHKVRTIINTIKYLKKIIKRLPKNDIDEKNNNRLLKQYNELVDLIIEHVTINKI